MIDCAYKLYCQDPEANIIFLFVGDGPAMDDLKAKVEDLNLSSKIRLLGFRSDTDRLLVSADLAFHAALGEGFSLSIVEYMSAGLPVLVPDIPSVRQAISPGATGYVYPPYDYQSVVGYILSLNLNPVLRGEMGRAAKDVADIKYTLDSCSREFVKAIGQVLDVD